MTLIEAIILAVGVIAWLAVSSGTALAVEANSDDQTSSEELKVEQDPTILLRRVWFDSEWNKYKDQSSRIKETLAGNWAWRASADQDWAVRLKVPMEIHVAGNEAGDSNTQGLGNIELAAGTAFRLNPSWRTGGGLELKMPSSTDEEIGDHVWLLKPFWAVAWDATSKLTFSPSAEYNKSVAEESAGKPEHFLEMFFPATYVLPGRWSVAARYEAKVDFERSDYWTHSAKFTVAKKLAGPPLGFSLSLKRPFDNGKKEFELNLIATYYFQPKKG